MNENWFNFAYEWSAIGTQGNNVISINREIVWVHSKNLEELVAGHLFKTVNSLAEFLVENIAKLFEINHSLFREACIEDKLPKIQFGRN